MEVRAVRPAQNKCIISIYKDVFSRNLSHGITGEREGRAKCLKEAPCYEGEKVRPQGNPREMQQQVHTDSGACMGAKLQVAGRLGDTAHLQQAKPVWCR